MTANPSINMGMRQKPVPQVAQPASTSTKSELVQFLEESCTGRKLYEFELVGFKGLGGKPVPKYLCRVLTKTETTRAIVGATKYVEEACAGTTLAKDDPDLTSDAKACWALYEACRDAARPDVFPAFPSPKWMMDNLTTDQIAVLWNNYKLCVTKEGPTVRELSDEMVADLSAACVSLMGTELPGRALSALPPDVLIEFALRQALMMAELKLELSAYADPSGYQPTEEEAPSGEASAPEPAAPDGEGNEGGGEPAQG